MLFKTTFSHDLIYLPTFCKGWPLPIDYSPNSIIFSIHLISSNRNPQFMALSSALNRLVMRPSLGSKCEVEWAKEISFVIYKFIFNCDEWNECMDKDVELWLSRFYAIQGLFDTSQFSMMQIVKVYGGKCKIYEGILGNFPTYRFTWTMSLQMNKKINDNGLQKCMSTYKTGIVIHSETNKNMNIRLYSVSKTFIYT